MENIGLIVMLVSSIFIVGVAMFFIGQTNGYDRYDKIHMKHYEDMSNLDKEFTERRYVMLTESIGRLQNVANTIMGIKEDTDGQE